MEKKCLDKLIGHKTKIITKEPNETTVSVTHGEIQAIDYENGFILVESEQGLGCLNIDTIMAIKPQTKRPRKHTSFKRDDNGFVGIGTLIVFIAMILVAAVAASVIIQASEGLQQQAQSVATQTTREVSAGIVIEDITAYTNAERTRITHVALMVRPRAGSKDIDLTTCTLSLLYDDLNVLSLGANLTVPVNLDGKSVFHTPVAAGSSDTILDQTTAQHFGVIVIHDADGSVMSTNGLNSGDRVYIIINLEAIVPSDNGLASRQTISGELSPETGASGVFEITTPAVFARRIVPLL